MRKSSYEYIHGLKGLVSGTHCFSHNSCCSTHIVERTRMHISELQVKGEGVSTRKQGKEKYPKNVFKESVVLRLVVNVSTFRQQLLGSPRLQGYTFGLLLERCI